MPSCSVTSEKVMSCVPEAAGGATQQVACSAVIGVPSANVVAPAIAPKDRHITIMPAASRRNVRPMDFVLIPTAPLLHPRIYLLSRNPLIHNRVTNSTKLPQFDANRVPHMLLSSACCCV